MTKGTIVVLDEGISVCCTEGQGSIKTSLPRSIEGLREATRLLAGWMDLSYENLADECQRIQAHDQLRAFFRNEVERFLEKVALGE